MQAGSLYCYMYILNKIGWRLSRLYVHVATVTHTVRGRKPLQLCICMGSLYKHMGDTVGGHKKLLPKVLPNILNILYKYKNDFESNRKYRDVGAKSTQTRIVASSSSGGCRISWRRVLLHYRAWIFWSHTYFRLKPYPFSIVWRKTSCSACQSIRLWLRFLLRHAKRFS